MDATETAEKVQNWQRTAEDVKETAQEWGQKARGKVRDAGAAADIYVHEYTWTTVAVVGVVACLLGYLLGSRRD